ncbi:hypothetical protein [Fructobacillus papyrifericola]|uniref:Uncharacterized protein n=1 Tax=Fructobacillus papyrifericola TaxID=2713172 RepID=A0ABS5QSF7_9LACO|nr:hypothetical protein [Fructobacillus papyrifericola]MBS9336141.1 hypothetical protein [Fructobacillus papyrifericola]
MRNRWVSFGNERVFFDEQSTARQVMAVEPSNLGVLDLSMPSAAGNSSPRHDDL